MIAFSLHKIPRKNTSDVLETISMMASLTGNWKFDVLVVSIGIFTIFYWLLRRKYSYWHRRGFKTQPEYGYTFGHFKKMLIDKMTFADFLNHLYTSTSEPFIGIYGILRPILLVREPELIQSILIRDFSHFTDRECQCFSHISIE